MILSLSRPRALWYLHSSCLFLPSPVRQLPQPRVHDGYTPWWSLLQVTIRVIISFFFGTPRSVINPGLKQLVVGYNKSLEKQPYRPLSTSLTLMAQAKLGVIFGSARIQVVGKWLPIRRRLVCVQRRARECTTSIIILCTSSWIAILLGAGLCVSNIEEKNCIYMHIYILYILLWVLCHPTFSLR